MEEENHYIGLHRKNRYQKTCQYLTREEKQEKNFKIFHRNNSYQETSWFIKRLFVVLWMIIIKLQVGNQDKIKKVSSPPLPLVTCKKETV